VPAPDRTVAIERHGVVDYIAILSFFVFAHLEKDQSGAREGTHVKEEKNEETGL